MGRRQALEEEKKMEHLPISDQAVLNRWRLVLGKNASGHMGLDGSLKGMDGPPMRQRCVIC